MSSKCQTFAFLCAASRKSKRITKMSLAHHLVEVRQNLRTSTSFQGFLNLQTTWTDFTSTEKPDVSKTSSDRVPEDRVSLSLHPKSIPDYTSLCLRRAGKKCKKINNAKLCHVQHKQALNSHIISSEAADTLCWQWRLSSQEGTLCQWPPFIKPFILIWWHTNTHMHTHTPHTHTHTPTHTHTQTDM